MAVFTNLHGKHDTAPWWLWGGAGAPHTEHTPARVDLVDKEDKVVMLDMVAMVALDSHFGLQGCKLR